MSERISWIEYLRSLPYQEYLQTSHWQLVRRTALEAANHRCQRCGERHEPLDVHHRTYANLGCEHPADVVALCRNCHEEVHAVPGYMAELSLSFAQLVTAVTTQKQLEADWAAGCEPLESLPDESVEDWYGRWRERRRDWQANRNRRIADGHWDAPAPTPTAY
jgi:hypothetical protein